MCYYAIFLPILHWQYLVFHKTNVFGSRVLLDSLYFYHHLSKTNAWFFDSEIVFIFSFGDFNLSWFNSLVKPKKERKRKRILPCLWDFLRGTNIFVSFGSSLSRDWEFTHQSLLVSLKQLLITKLLLLKSTWQKKKEEKTNRRTCLQDNATDSVGISLTVQTFSAPRYLIIPL